MTNKALKITQHAKSDTPFNLSHVLTTSLKNWMDEEEKTELKTQIMLGVFGFRLKEGCSSVNMDFLD